MIRLRARLLVALVLVGLLVLPQLALAASYRFTDVNMRAAIAPNGDLAIQEARTARIEGSATYIYWDFPTRGTGGYRITSARVNGQALSLTTDPSAPDRRPEGEYFVRDEGNNVHVEAYFRTDGGDIRFDLGYTALGAAKRYTDTSELYYQFISGGWGAPTDRVHVDLTFPPGVQKGDVRAWAHGPLNGVVAIKGTPSAPSVTLDVTRLPANTFVEGRVLFPAAALPQAPLVNHAERQAVLAEEGRLAAEANTKRRNAKLAVGFAWAAVLLISAAGLALGLWLFLRYGREYKPQFPGGYFREDPQPDLHPAVIGALWRMHQPGDQEIAATLMDLTNRAVVKMEKTTVREGGLFGIGAHDEETYAMTFDTSKRDQLAPLDQRLTDFLFGEVADGGSLTVEGMKAWAKANPQRWTDELRDWKGQAYDEALAKGFFEKGSYGWAALMFVLAFAMGGVAIWLAISVGSFLLGAVGVLAAIPVLAMAPFMGRRSKAAVELHAKYHSLRDYLRDFSRLNEAPPMHVILWERFLVLAVVFGIAEEVIAALRVKAPEVVRDPNFAMTYWWVASSDMRGGSPAQAMTAGFASASQVAHSQMSSSSGMGGGFSGGGGGGIGGGGGGGIG